LFIYSIQLVSNSLTKNLGAIFLCFLEKVHSKHLGEETTHIIKYAAQKACINELKNSLDEIFE